MARNLPTCTLLMVALGFLSASIVVGYAATYARVVAVAIFIAMYCSKGVRPLRATSLCAPATPYARKAVILNIWGSATNA